MWLRIPQFFPWLGFLFYVSVATTFDSFPENDQLISDQIKISKCCGQDEVIEFNGTSPSCKPVRGDRLWTPVFYSNPYQKLMKNATILENNNISYGSFSILNPSSDAVGCETWKYSPWDLFPFYNDFMRTYWRLLPNGTVALLNPEREWEYLTHKDRFCIDGVQTFGSKDSSYSGKEEDQILLECKESNFESDGDDEIHKELIYVFLCFASAFLYLLTTVVYVLLLSKHNSTGWTILGYVGSLFALQTLIGICHLANYLSHFPQLGFSIELNSWTSWSIAVSTHYFLLSGYMWTTLITIDLLWKIRSKVVLLTTDGGLCKFLLYSLLGWGLPLLLVSGFVLLDRVFKDPLTEVKVPMYGVNNTFITAGAQGFYHFYIISALFLLNMGNFLFILYTFWVLKKSTTFITQDRRSSCSLGEFITFKLFAKLFILTGFIWILEVISWLHAGNNNPWYWVFADVLIHLQSVGVFFILACNVRVKNALEVKLGMVKGSASGQRTSVNSFFHRPKSNESCKSISTMV